MSTETEVKVKIHSPEDFCESLKDFNPRIISTRHFEDNHILDFEDNALHSSQCLVRIRYAQEKTFITYKGPPQEDGIFKTREELETRVDDGETALQILQRLGMRIWFHYQKYRREFEVDSVIITVDETPIGNYIEFEGTESGIRGLTHGLGIEETQFMRQSYYDLYLEHCRVNKKVPGNMVF